MRHPLFADVGPTLGERQRRGAERPAFPLSLPRATLGVDAIARQACSKGRHEHRAKAIAAPRYFIGLSVHEQWIADVVPRQRHLLAPCHRTLGPEIARVAGFAELGLRDR